MTTGRRIHLPGFRLDRKTGKPTRDQRQLDVSARLKRASSKRVRIIRKGQAR